MKQFLKYSIPVFLGLLSFSPREEHLLIDKNVFGPSEKLEFRVHYGFINAGEATIETYPQMYKVNDKVCYKGSVSGRTSGPFDLALNIRDTWVSYFDSSNCIPQKFYRDIEEGKYRLKEHVLYDYKTGLANVEREGKNGEDKSRVSYKIPDDVVDIVSGYFFLRTVNYNALKIGDTVNTTAFFEDKVYDFKVRFLGKGRIHTKFGKINAIKISPVMPDNKLFEGGNSIRMWLSDDKNKIPVKIEADLFVGAVEMDLKSYKGLKNPINFKD
jgi:hypothetical protein